MKRLPKTIFVKLYLQRMQLGGKMKDRMLQFFVWGHLPERLQPISEPFAKLALQIVEKLPANPERTVALRKLLEAKDCAVRAFLYTESGD